MLDLHNEQKRGRLRQAIQKSGELLEPFRRVRRELVRDYVGSWYSTEGARAKTLVNLLNQTARIYMVALASNNPRVLVSTPHVEQWPFAMRFEANLNQLIADMELDVTFRSIVLDAFFCLGVAVVMMRDTDTRFHGLLESEEDVWLDPGEPWLNRVSVDNLILDMSAKEISKMRYCGHKFRADFEKVRAEPGYDKKVKAKLTPSSKTSAETSTPSQTIASAGEATDDILKPMVWLQNVWIPENQSVATMAVDQDLPPLLEKRWTGSQAGPYKFLSLGNVPDNIIPVSPAMNLKGMHDLQNRVHCRMEEDSDAHKFLNTYSPAGADDAKVLQNAARNAWVRMNNPREVQRVEIGGIDQRDQAFALFLTDEYDRLAGNLAAMGGLGPQSGTVGQDELIQGQVSRMEADLRMAVVKFANECILDLGRLMWEDQFLTLKASIPIGNAGDEIISEWAPGNRVGNFEDYRFTVERYSMAYRTPDQKLQETFQVLREIAPLWPMFQASGATLDAKAIVDDIARLKNRPEFKRYITFASSADRLGGDENTVRQSPVTTRETVRRNIPTGGTREGRSAMLQQAYMGGGNLNGQQRAAMTQRPA